MLARTVKRGFTLVEILIVVIILGILAAIVIPQFTNASQDARKSSLVSQLQTLRSQIELYKLQHQDTLPDLVTSWSPMLDATDATGKTAANAGVAPFFGPYMQAIPSNPLNNLTNVVNGAYDPTAPAPASASCGFMYDYAAGAGTGRIWGTDTTGTVIYVEN